jgi:glycerol-3-phosphate dehydrogenase (NAD(P)+)
VRVTVLGAGYMGSAMAEVAALRGHDVRLWGTWLDDALIAPVERGEPHPRLKKTLSPRIRPYRSDALQPSLEGAELVIHGVSSDGVAEVLRKAAPYLPDVPIVSVTKGFLQAGHQRMDRVDVVASEQAGRPLRYVHAAGPAKAMEVSRGVLTWMFFASHDERDAKRCAEALSSDRLHISVSSDLPGAEICSALKNAYATGLGLWDGWVGADCHNARAACFQQAIVEMAKLVVAGGGRLETTYGPAGIGDLHVTAAAGRNRAFGERVGKGKRADVVAEEMRASGELTEGYPAIASALRWANEQGVTELPLLRALHRVVWEHADVGETLSELTLSAG